MRVKRELASSLLFLPHEDISKNLKPQEDPTMLASWPQSSSLQNCWKCISVSHPLYGVLLWQPQGFQGGTVPCCAQFSCVWLFTTLWTVAHQTPLSRDSPGKKTGEGCHALLQGIFLTQGSNPYLLCFLHWQVGSLPLAPPGVLRQGSVVGKLHHLGSFQASFSLDPCVNFHQLNSGILNKLKSRNNILNP